MRKAYTIDSEAMDKITPEEWAHNYDIVLSARLSQLRQVNTSSLSLSDKAIWQLLLWDLGSLIYLIRTEGWNELRFAEIEAITYPIDGIIHFNHLEEPKLKLLPAEREFLDELASRYMIEVPFPE